MSQVETRKFSLSGIFTAWETNHPKNCEVFLTELKGWDEDRIEIETVPALFGTGSYVTERHIPEREITAVITIASETLSLRAVKQSIATAMYSMNEIAIVRTFGASRTETINALVTAITEYKGYSDTQGEIKITMLAKSPLKTVL